MRKRLTAAPVKRLLSCLLALLLLCTPWGTRAQGGEDVILGGRDATGTHGVIATGRAECTEIGLDILKRGGNAIDAAVAVGFALGVCEQQSSGIGGGGFMTLRLATGETFFVDFRDRSGAAASLDMWEVNPDGSVKNEENKIGGKAVAVPGDVKGLLYALETWGTMSRAEAMAPAIRMAEEGFTVSHITLYRRGLNHPKAAQATLHPLRRKRALLSANAASLPSDSCHSTSCMNATGASDGCTASSAARSHCGNDSGPIPL